MLLREHFRDSGESLCGVVEKNKKREERENKIKSESTLTISSYQNGFAVNLFFTDFLSDYQTKRLDLFLEDRGLGCASALCSPI